MINWALQFLSFFCVALGQPAWLPWLGPLAASVGFALHWYAMEGMTFRAAQRLSFLWFFTVQLVQLSWMVSFEYLGVSIFFVYLALSALLGLQFAWMTRILVQLQPGRWAFFCSLASFWVLLEWIRLKVFCGFAFNFVGISLSCYTWPLQVASLFGVLGMSFLVMFTNLMAWKALRSSSWKGWVVFVFSPYIYGCFHVWYQDSRQSKDEQVISALLVQPAIPLSQKYCLLGREEEFLPPRKQWENIMRSISAYRDKSLDLLVFPEAVLPWGLNLYGYPLQDVRLLFERYFGSKVQGCFPPLMKPFCEEGRVSNAYCMQTLANIFRAPVVAGLDCEGAPGCFYNSAFYFEPGSSLSPLRYDKRVLLPLAEYMPFPWLSFLSRLYGIEDFFQRGERPCVWGAHKISPSICYEELFSSVVREGRKKGAKLFVNLSNDGYYPLTKLPVQHFTQGLIRSVENGVPLMRACNTGVTAAVDGLGRVLGKLEDSQGNVEKIAGCLCVQVLDRSYWTLYTCLGDYPLLCFCLIFVGLGMRRWWDFPVKSCEIGLDENAQRR